MAHEWYCNIITMIDMADRWVQEGFAAPGEELMMEYHFVSDIEGFTMPVNVISPDSIRIQEQQTGR